MDKKTEKSNKDKILRRVSKELKELEFSRAKTTFFVREIGPIIEFLHFHKYSFAPNFRIHTCVRVLNDQTDWIALQGFDSQPYQCPDSPNGKKYIFNFHKTNESIDRSVKNIGEFVNEVSIPWFKTWSDPTMLIINEDSPLDEDEKNALKEALDGNVNDQSILSSRKLFKLAK